MQSRFGKKSSESHFTSCQAVSFCHNNDTRLQKRNVALNWGEEAHVGRWHQEYVNEVTKW